ncbi:MAG: nitroreductase/quinone reductase family protein [Candidatus Acidiferrales bacterium]
MGTTPSMPAFREPSALEKFLNRAFGFLVGLGIAPGDYYLLQVRGRKSGRIYSTPVNPLECKGKRFLVAPRGRTQWVRNAETAGVVTLKRGGTRLQFQVRALPNQERPEILKQYLDRFASTVQRYFPVPKGSPPQAFASFAEQYPVFELLAPA